MKKKVQIILLLICWSVLVTGQNESSNTLVYNDTTGSPKADLSALTWIAGHWRGEAFGGITEEVWTPALGKSMMCAFKLVIDDEVKFYELVTIAEENNSLILRLKHFHQNLVGWEDKEETVDFKLVKVTKDKVYFDGFTFERVNGDEMNIYVVIENGEEKMETKFNYKRVQE